MSEFLFYGVCVGAQLSCFGGGLIFFHGGYNGVYGCCLAVGEFGGEVFAVGEAAGAFAVADGILLSLQAVVYVCIFHVGVFVFGVWRMGLRVRGFCSFPNARRGVYVQTAKGGPRLTARLPFCLIGYAVCCVFSGLD